jgi:hypothetical protein
MANRKISDLTALTAPATGDLLPIVDISEAAAADKNKKITYGELLASAPAGSAAAPSFSFDGDPNTGIFNPAADTLAFAEGGSEVMRLDSSGRLGLGTSAPGSQLDVVSPGNSNALRTLVGSTVYFSVSNNSNGAIVDFSDNGGTLRNRIDARAGSPSYFTAGNVGIGTTSPGAKLVVTGTDALVAVFGRTGSAGSQIALTDAASSVGIGCSSGALTFGANGYETERGRFDTSGRFLVGTSTALTGSAGAYASQYSRSVVVGNSSGSAIGISALGYSGAGTGLANNTGIAVLNFTDNAAALFAHILCETDGTTGASDYPGRLVFATTADGAASPTERMRVNSAGDVFLNRTTQIGTAKFSVAPDSSEDGIAVTSNGGGTGTGYAYNSASTTGYPAFFTTSAGNAGNIFCSGTSTTFATSSDYRLKQAIQPIDGAITRFQLLNPVSFEWIHNSERVDGFIAHEVQEVVPEAIVGEKDAVNEDGSIKSQGIDQSKLVPLLTAALQEAIGRIKALEADVALLKGA